MTPRKCRCRPTPLVFEANWCSKCGHVLRLPAAIHARVSEISSDVALSVTEDVDDVRVTAPFVDGRALVALLEERGELTRLCRDPHIARRVSEYKRGGTATVDMADALLVEAGAHLLDLEPEAFRQHKNGHRNGRHPDQDELPGWVAALGAKENA